MDRFQFLSDCEISNTFNFQLAQLLFGVSCLKGLDFAVVFFENFEQQDKMDVSNRIED